MKHALIELPDNFEKGQCYDCPCMYYDTDGYDLQNKCVFECRYDECPLEIKEDKE